MFKKKKDVVYRQLKEGVQLSTLVHGNRTSLVEFKLKAGTEIPLHDHPYEQTGTLISGAVVFQIGEQEFLAMPGDAWCIPEMVRHGAKVLEDSVIVEVFSPPREDYM